MEGDKEVIHSSSSLNCETRFAMKSLDHLLGVSFLKVTVAVFGTAEAVEEEGAEACGCAR